MIPSLFTQGERVPEIYCYRVSRVLSSFGKYQRKKKAKKIQKDVLRSNVGITPPAYEIASVHTGPIEYFYDPFDPPETQPRTKSEEKLVLFDICNCGDKANMTKEKYTPRTWDSIENMYGDIDTTQIWVEPNDLKTYNKYERKRKNKNAENIAMDSIDQIKDGRRRGKKKYKNKTATHKKKNKRNGKNHRVSNKTDGQDNYTLDKNNDDTNRASVVSLYRNIKNNRKSPKTKLKFEKVPKSKRKQHNGLCKCDNDIQDYDNGLNTYKLHCYNENCEFRNKSERKKMKHDTTPESINVAIDKECLRGPCIEAIRKKKKNFLCKCIKRKTEPEFAPKDCSDATCKIPTNSLSVNSVVKMKEKILCLCRKYSQKIVNMKHYHANLCKEGLCQEALKDNKRKFICKCNKERQINECANDTCGKYTNIGHGDQTLPKKKESISFSTKSGLLKYMFKQKQKIDDTIVNLEHASEQTGEPFFEVKVNPFDMCVLNPTEIRAKVIKYGKTEKNKLECNCPSRTHLRPEEVCRRGVCKRALKNKQTNFNCKCEKILTECEDSTCGINDKRDLLKNAKKKNLRVPEQNKPLFEVQLDRDKMCILNTQEIENRIRNNKTVDEICSSGVCKEAALKHNMPFYCKCIGRKMIPDTTECTEGTCTENKKSKFSIFCTRICSKSENWTSRNKKTRRKRVRRRSYYDIGPNKLSRSKHRVKKHYDLTENVPLQENPDLDNNKITITHETVETVRSNNKPIERKDFTKREEIQLKNVLCTCSHACECNIYDPKSEGKKFKNKEKLERKKQKQKMRNKKKGQRNLTRDMKRRAKLDRKREKKAAKERLKEIRMMKKKMKEEPLDTNCCTACLLGILKIGIKTAFFIFSIIIAIIMDPRGSFWYVRDKLKDPKGTYNKMAKWFVDALIIKKLQISETVRGSETMTILADHFQDSAFYQSFADKGKTKKDQMLFEQKSKARKRRIRKRQEQAIFSCRHTLLTTLRQTPCLWVYHICPNFYPQCLSLLTFMRSFSHILLFLAAFACWTPCIVSFELCRAMMCCFMCTH